MVNKDNNWYNNTFFVEIPNLTRFLKGLTILVFSLYVTGCGILYVIQDDLLFRPEPIPSGTQFRFGEEIKLPVAHDIELHGLYHQVDQPEGVILYLHGNKGNARRCQRQAEMFAGYNYNVLLLDYRGYGKSDGEIISGGQLYSDVQKVYDYLKERFDESQIIISGYSIGTGMASYLAAANSPQRLILIAPYESIIAMKDRYLPIIPDFLIKFPLNNQKHLSQLNCPVTIFHGTEDEVIPYQASLNLKKLFPNKVDLITLQGTSHRRSIFHGAISDALGRYL